MNAVEATLPSLLEDFSDIRSSYKVKEEEFAKGIRFCLLVTSYTSAKKAYKEIFGDNGNLNRDYVAYMKKKWVDALMKRMHASNYLLFSDTRNKVLSRMSEMALDESLTTKAQIDAAKVFLDNTSMPEVSSHEVTIDVSNEAKETFMNLVNGIAAIANQGKHINQNGEIVEVELLQ